MVRIYRSDTDNEDFMAVEYEKGDDVAIRLGDEDNAYLKAVVLGSPKLRDLIAQLTAIADDVDGAAASPLASGDDFTTDL